MNPDIYLMQDGHETGPFTSEQIRAAIVNDEIPDTLNAWFDGMTDWQRISIVLYSYPSVPTKSSAAFAAATAARVVPNALPAVPSLDPKPPKVGFIHKPSPTNGFIITGIDVPFMQIANFLLKVCLALIPVSIALTVVFWILVGALAALSTAHR